MAANQKKSQQFAKQLFRLSLVDGVISPERVTGVLEYVEKHKPANPLQVLKTYQRLVATELAKSRAVVEHAGSIDNSVLKTIAATFSKRYNRAITAVGKPNSSLIAGLRVRVGDDVYESSVAGRLESLISNS
jgi:F-type H+-transporting ATPase subunit delta